MWTTRPTRPAGVAVAVAFVANPYVVTGGGTTPTLLPYALLPWLLITLRRAVRDPGSWRWPAAAALVFFAMSGINAGVVPILQLVAVPALLVDAHVRDRVSAKSMLRALAKSAVLVVGVSSYWLVPAISALGAASAIAGTTETLEAIAAPSSYGEVLRGLGFWPLYGSDGEGPFQPGYTSYLVAPLVVLGSYTVALAAAAGALVSRSRARLLGVLLVATAAPIMVGSFPGDQPGSRAGAALREAFRSVPGAVAFRTTNKAGGVLMLGLALLVGCGAAAFVVRFPRPEHRVLPAVAAAVLVPLSIAPALTGDLYDVRMAVPEYWQQAASDLDAGRRDARVLLLPGIVNARYRWGYEGPDDVALSLLDKSAVVRTTVPNGSPYAANLLAAVDTAVNDRNVPPGLLSSVARYVGADQVLVRADLAWEQVAGARPAEVAAQVDADAGLVPAAAYGAPGAYTTGAPGEGPPDPARLADGQMSPLLRYDVATAVPAVRAELAHGALVVDGDGAALPGLARAGLLDGRPVLRMAADLTSAELAAVARDGARLVVTDSNRRQRWNTHRLSTPTGPLLTAEEDPAPTRALHAAADQTVAVLDGAASVTASRTGSVFGGPVPTG
jgi:arabinofuranan 3-O-arabinosyltransferase